jgi:hypothetical protein
LVGEETERRGLKRMDVAAGEELRRRRRLVMAKRERSGGGFTAVVTMGIDGK